MTDEYDHIYKILLIGNASVGKSSIVIRYTENTFRDNLLNSIGVDFKVKAINIDKKKIKIQIWDTAGQERFRSITSGYYKGAHAIVVVYDVTRLETFNALPGWLNEIEKHGKEGVMKILVGNKSDLVDQRQVKYEKAKEIADGHKMMFYETSAKDTSNVDKLFEETCRVFLSQQMKGEDSGKKGNFVEGTNLLGNSNNETTTEKKGGCC